MPGENFDGFIHRNPPGFQTFFHLTFGQRALRLPDNFADKIAAGVQIVFIIFIDCKVAEKRFHKKTGFLRQFPDAAGFIAFICFHTTAGNHPLIAFWFIGKQNISFLHHDAATGFSDFCGFGQTIAAVNIDCFHTKHLRFEICFQILMKNKVKIQAYPYYSKKMQPGSFAG